jgi:hypothetical protein
MFFALYDLYHYHRRSGRYRRGAEHRNLMGLAFKERLPDAVVNGLRPGDMLYSLTFDNLLSWLILYSTKGHVNHAAMYVGDGMIMHSTINAGVISEPVEVLYGPNERILPCVPNWPDDARARVKETAAEMLGVPYGWAMVRRKALRLLTGHAWPVFHWSLFLDICFIILILDIPVFLLLGYPLFVSLIPLYLILILFNRLRWQYRPLSFGEMAGYPTHSLEIYYFHWGASLIPDFDALSQDPSVTAYRFKDDDSRRKFMEMYSDNEKGND